MKRRQFTNQLVVAAILLSLLFSVGEGMRLNPFGFRNKLAEVAKGQKKLRKTSLTLCGPIDVPAQQGPRNKRVIVEVDVPPFHKPVESDFLASVVTAPPVISSFQALAPALLKRGPPTVASI